jgi:hypothetical protein
VLKGNGIPTSGVTTIGMVWAVCGSDSWSVTEF